MSLSRNKLFRPRLEVLEDRTVLSVTFTGTGNTGDVTVTGTAAADNFIIRLDPSNSANIQFSDNGGSSFTTAALSTLGTVTVDGLAGNDTLTIDDTNGIVGTASANLSVTFNGGTGQDRVILQGSLPTGDTISNVTFTPRSTLSGVTTPDLLTVTGTNGSSAAGLNLNLTSVSAITDLTVASTLTINGNNQNNIIRIGNGTSANGPATNVVQGIDRRDLDLDGLDHNRDDRFDDSGEDSEDDDEDMPPSGVSTAIGDDGFPSLTFANKANVVVNAQGGDDLILVNVTTPAAGLTNLTINGGTGTNVLALLSPVPSGVNLTTTGISATLTDPESIFLEELYQLRLGRNIEDAGRLAWLNVLHSQGRGAVVRGIEESEEAREGLVRSWYEHYLGREANGGEEMGWVNALMQGVREETILAGIIGSQEFRDRAQSLIGTGSADERVVRALYSLILNRDAAQSDVDDWVSVLPTFGAGGIAQFFLESQEFRGNEVFALYHTLMHRNGDSGGAHGWISSPFTSMQLREAFEGAEEFFMGS
jgi:hypothetical protein